MYTQLLDRAQLVIYDVVLDRLVRDQQQKKEG
jgi:hypothetical protein